MMCQIEKGSGFKGSGPFEFGIRNADCGIQKEQGAGLSYECLGLEAGGGKLRDKD
jgi:hypothetical protein